MTDLTALTIAEARDRLRARDFTASELTEAYLTAIDAGNGALNAYVSVTHDKARTMAKASDARLGKGDAGALEGIPLGIKDLYATEGDHTQACSHVLDGFEPRYESTVTQNGDDGGVNVDQVAQGNISTVTQNAGGSLNTADINQNGDFDSSFVEQSDLNNSAIVTQEGFDLDGSLLANSSTVIQSGTDNDATVSQVGDNNSSFVGQSGTEDQAFLVSGEPPVVVTLGTSGASARPEVFEHVAGVLDDLGARGVFLTSNAAVTERVRAAGVAKRHGVWPFVPLEPLLRRARGLVQSGAHGTNALALEAGKPSLIVPCLFDQLWHARRQQALGTGIWIRRDRDLARGMRRLLTDEALDGRARELGAEIAAEDGTAVACDEIEAFLRGS